MVEEELVVIDDELVDALLEARYATLPIAATRITIMTTIVAVLDIADMFLS